MRIKRCRGYCRQTLPISEFNKDRSQKDGLLDWCKKCQNTGLKNRQRMVEIRRHQAVRRYWVSGPGQKLIREYFLRQSSVVHVELRKP